MKIALLALTLSLPIGVTVSPANGHIAWVNGTTSQVWVANADGSGAHKVGEPWSQGVGQVTWTRYGLLVDSNYTLFLLGQNGHVTKIGGLGDQTFSVGGVRAASGSAGCGYCKGPVTVYNVRTHTAIRVGDPKQANEDAALSPDGSRVAYSADGRLVDQAVWGGPTHSLGVTGGCTSWSPNGRTLAFYHLNVLETIPAAGGKPTVLLHKAVCGLSPRWSPDSQTVALSYGPGRLALVNVRTHAARKTPIAYGRLTDVTWSPDGTSLVAAFRRGYDDCGSVVRIDVSTLARTTVVRGCP